MDGDAHDGLRGQPIAANPWQRRVKAGLAASASAGSGPVTSVSFRVYPAPVTVSGGPGIVVTRVWSHGVLTISAD
jgi:hypothetical protein